jgi:ubiquinone biosynthesis protein
MDRLARTLEARTRWGSAFGLRSLAQGFAEALREELDFRIERDNLNAVASALAAAPSNAVRVPVTHPRLCTERVLVMERLPGTPLGTAGSALSALDADERQRIAAALLDAVLDQVLHHGLFHVDLHPGNVLVSEHGSLGLLDFGSVGRLDATSRTALAQLMAALGRADSLAATDALLELVDRPDEIDERALERSVGALIVRYASPGTAGTMAAFPALMRLVVTHRLAIPAQIAAVFRAFATVEGTLSIIDPRFDLIAEARAAGGRQMAQAATGHRLRQTAEDELLTLLPLLRRLPAASTASPTPRNMAGSA